MKKNLFIIFVLFVSVIRSQTLLKNSELYIKYDSVKGMFTKEIVIETDSLEYIKYKIKIPNQDNPSIVLQFKDNNLVKRIKGYNPFFEYKYFFIYDSRLRTEEQIKIKDYSKNYLDFYEIIASDQDEFREVLERTDKIFIIEESLDENTFISREVILND